MGTPDSTVRLQAADDTHTVFNQTPALADFNAFDADPALREAVAREGAAWALPQLSDYGARTGCAEVIQWGFDANEFRPQFSSHDRAMWRSSSAT